MSIGVQNETLFFYSGPPIPLLLTNGLPSLRQSAMSADLALALKKALEDNAAKDVCCMAIPPPTFE